MVGLEKEKGIWSISNVISLRQDYDECSEGLIKNAIDKGYCKREKDFNFRKCYSDKFMTWAAKGMEREKRSRVLLFQNDKKFILKDFIGILRDHGKGMDSREWSPEKSEASLCLHAKDPLIRRTQTICSMVAKLGQENNFYFTTGASNPCLSPFFPIFLRILGFRKIIRKAEHITIKILSGGKAKNFIAMPCVTFAMHYWKYIRFTGILKKK